MTLRGFDVLVVGIIVVFAVAVGTRGYPLFLQHRGPGHLGEFLFYAAATLLTTAVLWAAFRRYEWPWWLLALVAFGVLLHTAASWVHIGDGRLYDLNLGPIRFDKVVHVVNAFVIALFTQRLFDLSGIRLGKLRALTIVLMTLGVGASWEIIEYLVKLTLPSNGVGDYHNNLTDLLANLVGSCLFLLVPARLAAPAAHRVATGDTEGLRKC